MGEQQRLTHVDEHGAARMVDVSGKDVTTRQAVATGRVLVSAEVVGLLLHLPEVERITYLHLEAVGPRRYFLVAAVDLRGDRRESDLARELRRLEARIEEEELVETAVLTVSAPEDPALAGPVPG